MVYPLKALGDVSPFQPQILSKHVLFVEILRELWINFQLPTHSIKRHVQLGFEQTYSIR
jgi:hypothetical protein